jgi:anti-sigma B factor antagonist
VNRLPAPASTGFSCETYRAAGRARVVLRGRLDRDTVAAVRSAADAALDAGSKILVIDLSALDFMDSSGLELARDVARSASRRGVVCAFVPGRAPVQRLFVLSGLDSRIAFVHSLPQANVTA